MRKALSRQSAAVSPSIHTMRCIWTGSLMNCAVPSRCRVEMLPGAGYQALNLSDSIVCVGCLGSFTLVWCLRRWVALPEDAQEEAAAATGFQPTLYDIAQPLELYGKWTADCWLQAVFITMVWMSAAASFPGDCKQLWSSFPWGEDIAALTSPAVVP